MAVALLGHVMLHVTLWGLGLAMRAAMMAAVRVLPGIVTRAATMADGTMHAALLGQRIVRCATGVNTTAIRSRLGTTHQPNLA